MFNIDFGNEKFEDELHYMVYNNKFCQLLEK